MKRLVLVGGGHAHVQVLRGLSDSRDFGVTLVTPSPIHIYSGMVPGIVAGHYALEEAQIDLAALAAKAGAELVLDKVVSFDARQARLASGRPLDFDLLSLNTGSVSTAPAHAIGLKPFEVFLKRWNEIRHGKPRIGIVGAGAAGLELAMAMKFAGAKEVVLFSDRNAFAGKLGDRMVQALQRNAVEIRNTKVGTVESGPTVAGERYDAVFWATGAAATPMLRESGLAVDDAGFARVDAALRSISHPNVFVAGDAAAFQGVPKSGVYAVRQGQVLAENLERFLQGQGLEPYKPQATSLSLISCGAKYAIASRGSWSAEGAWAWRWKDWIDRRWIERFR